MSFGNIFKDIGDWTSRNSNTLANIGKFATPIVQGIGAYGQYRTAKDNNALMRDSYDLNKQLLSRDIAKENLSQENFTDGWASVFGQQDKKKKLSDYTGTMNYQG